MNNAKKPRIFCIQCKQPTNHDILKTATAHYTPENTQIMSIDWADATWDILQCCGCETVTFRETWTNSEDFDSYIGEWIPDIKLYPSRGVGLLDIKTYYSTPSKLRRLYREVIDCYNNGCHTLCAAGLRVLIEGICSDKNVINGTVKTKDKQGNEKITVKKNLQGKIEGLVEAGILTKMHAGILHEHRFLGNNAVHQLDTPSSDELKLAIEIIEHTLENVYELSNKADLLRINKVTRPC